ncbi:MAG: hypothetical protein PHU25_04845 [Deltaproteobacteria bacterium]|nr:hypothetical protein [Deltaproteobacteria bacterium]
MTVNKKRIEPIAAGAARDLSLCSTCNDVETCTSRKNWRGPVVFCEEFDCRAAATMSAPRLEVVSVAPPLAAGRMGGLCTNCGRRTECALPTHEGGVWHCEEYD